MRTQLQRWLTKGLGLILCMALAPAWSQSTVTYVYSDPQGTPLAEADASGAITASFDYRPYGTQALGSAPNGPGYTGHVNDPDTGLVYMQARYYDPDIGRFLSVDPAGLSAGALFSFNRYDYANNNPIVNIDPDGRSITEALGGLFYKSYQFVRGNGFDGASIVGALKDGYNGEGEGVVHAVLEDVNTVSIVAGGAGALKGAASLARQTGEEVVENLANGAVKDIVRGPLRQIIKAGGEKQMRKDAAIAMKGAKNIKTVKGPKGVVKVAEHSDGSTVGMRSFSGRDGQGPSTIQVDLPNSGNVTKVRYLDDVK